MSAVRMIEDGKPLTEIVAAGVDPVDYTKAVLLMVPMSHPEAGDIIVSKMAAYIHAYKPRDHVNAEIDRVKAVLNGWIGK